MARSIRFLAPVLVPVAGLALVAAAVVAVAGRSERATAEPPGSTSGAASQHLELTSFSTCDALLAYYRTNALKLVGPYGLGEGPIMHPGVAYDAAVPGALSRDMTVSGGGTADTPVPRLPGAAAEAGSNGAGTGTNVQVGGVDEADLAKVVNGRMYAVLNSGGMNASTLRVVDLGHDTPKVLGTLKLDGWSADQLLIAGDRLLLVGNVAPIASPAPTAKPTTRGGAQAILPRDSGLAMSTRLVEVDVSDGTAPKIVKVVDVDGSVVGARLVDGVARLGISAAAGRLPFVYPGNDTPAAQDRALKANQDLVRKSILDDWLPRMVTRPLSSAGKIDNSGASERLVGCGDVAAPAQFSGLDTLTLMTVDLARGGLAQTDSGAVVASGSTMYATADHTYVATNPWRPGWMTTSGAGRLSTELARQATTQIHLFATPNDAPPTYLASGEVPGTLIGQYAMDEYHGVLRVASTTQPDAVDVPGTAVETAPAASASPGSGSGSGSGNGSGSGSGSFSAGGLPVPAPAQLTPTQVSQSRVTTLRQRGKALVTLGSVAGLGKGESIRSVRFIDDVGYVDTYRQTDPLYTLDLSNPAHPAVVGKLELLGYSAYLHPAGKGLLLGLGQDATAQGRTTGLQLSLFDVSDPAKPRRLSQVPLGSAYSSAAEGDSHAFTYADHLALVPFESWRVLPVPTPPLAPAETHDAGVVAVRVAPDGLSQPAILRLVGNGPVTVDPRRDVTTADWYEAVPVRTYVVDGVVYTLAMGGVGAHDATSFTRLAYTRF